MNDLVASCTDPEAGLVKRVGLPSGFSYKVHGGVDGGVDGGRARLITALEVTSGEVADEHLLERLRKEHAGTTGRTVAAVVADTKYGTHANDAALEQAGIRASIPSVSAVRLRGTSGADRFVSEAAADRSRCPTGQLLTRSGAARTIVPGGGVIYRARTTVCRACPVQARCCAGAAARSVIRPNDQALRDRGAASLRTRTARRHRRRRAPWIETANAELKERHGLRRARGRGREPMLLQALGAAIAYDVKKLAQLRRPGPAAGGAALLQAVRLTGCRRCTRRAAPRGEPGRRFRHYGQSRSRSPHRDATVEPDFGNRPGRERNRYRSRHRLRVPRARQRPGVTPRGAAGAPARRGAGPSPGRRTPRGWR